MKKKNNDSTLLRKLLQRHRNSLYIMGCGNQPGQRNGGWSTFAPGFNQVRREQLINKSMDLLSRIKTDWTVVLFVFLERDGRDVFEVEEVAVTNLNAGDLDYHLTTRLNEFWYEQEVSERISTGWYAVPSNDFNVDGQLDNFYEIWSRLGCWDREVAKMFSAARQEKHDVHLAKVKQRGDVIPYIDPSLNE